MGLRSARPAQSRIRKGLFGFTYVKRNAFHGLESTNVPENSSSYKAPYGS